MSEDSEPTPLGERRQHRRLIRFDPTFSSGAIATICSMLITVIVAYGKYEADRATTNKDIEILKANALAEKVIAKEAVTELRQDVRKVQETVTSVDKTVTGIKAEIDAGRKSKQ